MIKGSSLLPSSGTWNATSADFPTKPTVGIAGTSLKHVCIRIGRAASCGVNQLRSVDLVLAMGFPFCVAGVKCQLTTHCFEASSSSGQPLDLSTSADVGFPFSSM